MSTNPNDPLQAFRRLARSIPQNSRAPYLFEDHVMRRVRSADARRVGSIGRLLWQAAFASLACAALCATLFFFQPSDVEEDGLGSFDDTSSSQTDFL